jgi:hypothetical protein
MARVDQPAGIVDADDQRPHLPGPVALARLVPGDDGLLAPLVLDLPPVVRPDAGGILRVQPLGHHPFHAVGLRDGPHRLEILAGERRRRLPVPAGQRQRLEQRPPVAVLHVEQRPPVQLQQVEHQVGHRGLRGQHGGLGRRADVHARLDRLEPGPAALPEHNDLPVKQQLLVRGARSKARQLRVGHRDVALGP